MVNYIPAGHRILVKRDEVEKVSKGGIDLSAVETVKEKQHLNRGTVLKIGSTCWGAQWLGGGATPWCKEGDKILFAKYAGTNYMDEETKEEFLLIQDEDVIMIIQEKE